MGAQNESQPLRRLLSGLSDACRELGVDPGAIASRIGLPAEALTNPNLMIANPLIGQMYGLVGQLTGADDISLRVAQTRRLDNLGVIGLVMKEQPTLLAATDVLRRHFGIHNEAVGISGVCRWLATLVDVQVFARSNLGLDIAHLTRFSAELAIGVLYRALDELSESSLTPLAVSFVHPRGAAMKSYVRTFNVEPLFDQELNSLTLAKPDMMRLRPGVDLRRSKQANAYIEAISATCETNESLS